LKFSIFGLLYFGAAGAEGVLDDQRNKNTSL